MKNPAFPDHCRENFERTDDALTEIKGLIVALELLHDEHRFAPPLSKEALAKDVLMKLVTDKLDAIEKLRQIEWTGQGGSSNTLTPEETAAARGLK
ncbi:hypothetical protein [Pontitalea aquivivens]|uniref:hypothetical protein n=1 Tax=Pontitalea aquivivens TaxID=3388663 RepID=UPI0039707D78